MGKLGLSVVGGGRCLVPEVNFGFLARARRPIVTKKETILAPTGFLGAFLLDALLKRCPAATVYCPPTAFVGNTFP